MEALQWRQKKVDEAKANVKAELDRVTAEQEPAGKLALILGNISRLEEATSTDDAVKRFVYIISALNHHRRYGGLSTAEINQLTSLAYAILKVGGVKPASSKLAGLYGEVHLMLSEIALSEGRVFEAVMEQRICTHLSGESPPGGKELHNLLAGINTLRLGNSELALRYLELAEPGVKGRNLAQARISRLRALRFALRLAEAQTLLADSERLDLGDDFQKELLWEGACQQIAADPNADLNPLVVMVYKEKSHFLASYLLEAFFWIRAVNSQKWFTALPKLKTLAQKKDLDLKGAGLFYKFAQELESAYDNGLPYSTRLNNMKRVMRDVRRLRNIDKELLVWLAFTRWLYRTRSLDMAAVTYLEYRSLSFRLTAGISSDALAIAGDLEAKNWMQELIRGE